MSNKLLFITLILLIVGAQANNDMSAERFADILKNMRQTDAPVFEQDAKTNVEDFIKGFLNGVGSAPVFSVIKPCIQYDEQILKNLAQAAVLLKSHSGDDVKKALKLVGEAAKVVPVAAAYCAATGLDIKRVIAMIEAFSNPTHFAFIAGRNILINHREVIREVKAIVSAYETKNYNDLGFWIGRAMTTVLIGMEEPAQPQDTKVDLQNFAKGFLQGVSSDDFFEEIKTCLKDDQEVAHDLQNAFALIRTKEPAKVKEGIKLIGDAIRLIPNAARECKVAEDKIQRIVKLINSFTNPRSFFYYVGKSLLINRVEVIHDIEGAVNAFTDKDFTKTGFFVGKAMATIFLHASMEPLDAKTDLQNFAKGFLQGVATDDFFDEIKTCIKDDQEVAHDLKAGIELIKTKEPAKVKEGVKLIGEAIRLIPNAARDCKIAEDKIQRIVKLINSFTSPRSFFYHVGKSLLINRVEVIHDIEGAVNSYIDKDFTKTGFFVGKAMATIFLHSAQMENLEVKTDLQNFARGFLQGVASDDFFEEIKTCIKDDVQIIHDLQGAIDLIKTREPAKVKEGVKLIGEAAKLIPNAARECKVADEKIQRIVKLINSFTNPRSFFYYVGKSLLINRVEVIHDIEGAVNSYIDKDFLKTGFFTGKAMATIFLHSVDVQDNKTDLESFAKGFLQGVESDDFFDEIKTCIKDDQEVAGNLQRGFDLIRTKEPAKVKEGVKLIGDAINLIPNAARDCKIAEDKIQRIVKLAKSFKDPKSFVYYVGKSLLINRVEVIHDIEEAVNAYVDKDFTQTGFFVGKAMATIFLHESLMTMDAKKEILNFAEGFLTGVGSAPLFKVIEICINEDKRIIEDIAKAIPDLRSKDPARVKRGLNYLADAVKIIPVAAASCAASRAEIIQIIKMIEMMQNPATLVLIVGRNILVNHKAVTHEIQEIHNAYDAQDYNKLGFWTGKTMTTVLLGQKSAAEIEASKTDLQNFAKGFLQGVESDSFFDEIKTCINDDEEIIRDLEKGISLIRTKEAAKVKEGIKLVGEAVRLVPNAARACKVAEDKIQRLVKLVKAFTDPKSFIYYVGKSLLINRVEVIHDVQGAVDAYQHKDFTKTGFFVGKAMATIFLQNFLAGDVDTYTQVQSQSDVRNFVEGFLIGAGSHPAFDELKSCIAEDQKVINDVKKAVELIRTKNPEKVKEGIKLIGEVSQIIPTAVQMCQATHADVKKLVDFIKSFTSPKSFLYYVGKSLIINRVEVISEVNHAIEGYYNQNYTTVGFWVGKAMDTIFLGDKRVLRADFVSHLNEQSGWKAGFPEKFKGMTIEEIKSQFLGANLIDYNEIQNLTVLDYEGLGNDIPKNFNSAEKWPECIHPIRDQQKCGSCWAFAASEALSDRLCIATEGKTNVVLSPQYFVSCNNILNHGCKGGNPLFSWWFLVREGLVTDECLPYQSGTGKNPVPCKSVKQCADGTPLKKYYAKKGSIALLTNPASIQTSILEHGPVEAGMLVYEDFLHYEGGIYKHTSGAPLGGHAVKIVGWGNENGQDYWIVANSWNTTWGEKGFFRIAFGQVGIDKMVVTGQADVTRIAQSEVTQWLF